jgi:hypothetical protein
MVDRIISLAVALSLALLVWLYARSRDQEVLDNVPIPVQITLPPGQEEQYALEVNGPSSVPVSFTGPPSRIRELRGMLQRGDLPIQVTLTVPEDRTEDGHFLDRYLDTVHIDAADVHAPPGVTPMIIEGRNRIPVTFHRLVERRLAVRVDSALEERAGQITLEPANVLVRGPQEVLDKVHFITTQPASLPAHGDGAMKGPLSLGPIPLVTELEGRAVRTTPGAVMVRWTPKPRIYELKARVQFLCPSNFPLRPKFIGDSRAGEITLRLQGPDMAEEPKILAYIDLTQGNFLAGLNHEAVRLQLPRDFQLIQDPPRPVAFELVATEAASRGLSGLPMQ